jgi:hypothetical protein
MNVLDTHARIVSDYQTCIHSFLNIADPAIRAVVHEELNRGKLWPEPLQLPTSSHPSRASSFRSQSIDERTMTSRSS